MSTSPSTISAIQELLQPLATLARPMFGEFALYHEGKVVALICDDRLYIKPTEEGRVFLGDRLEEGHPYPGSRLFFCIDEDRWSEGTFLRHLIELTARSLPASKQKRSRKMK